MRIFISILRTLRRTVMALIVKTYLLLCVVGLCMTLFIILMMYGDDHARLDIQSHIRRMKPDMFGNLAGHMISNTSKVHHVPIDDHIKHTVDNLDVHNAKDWVAKLNRVCKPHNNIVLSKTHKCSSSTLQNILYRWGDDHSLTFVLPGGTWPYLGNPGLFNKKFALESADGVYNIFANHARFSNKSISEIMPRDTIYITILRNPTTQYESLYSYYTYIQRYGTNLSNFLMNPEMYFAKEPLNVPQVGRNSMLFDLGLDARHMEANSDRVSEWIQMMDNKFSLVLIAEYFAESLILLKDHLCWSMDDIVYLNQNARSAGSVKNITLTMQERILKWNNADAKLYNHFNHTLWLKIEAYGYDRMKRAVELLNRKNALLTADCVQKKLQSGDPRMWYPPGVKMESFRVNPHAKNKTLCDKVTRPELTYMKLLADKQRRRNADIRRNAKRNKAHSNMKHLKQSNKKPHPGSHI